MGRPARTFDDARAWERLGTELFLGAAGLDDAAIAEAGALPGWSRGNVIAHVAANADALGNLVHWAATGEPTPMYASPDERAAGIEKGSVLPAAELTEWLRRSAGELAASTAALDDEQWDNEVVTVQGRTVPATELPWMRSREVCVHAVDLGTGLSFADLPDGFLAALCDDVVGKRSRNTAGPALRLDATDTADSWDLPGEGTPTVLAGPLFQVTAYLTGRAHALTTAAGAPAPEIGPWL
ncbi:maleylpyruvate isomerase family mycothiol-dependent enzyme [Streptomyces sp. NPDC088812]|uniref:maleylpyruvate isomerase family mycothiol-dependent enzyme n=1 Tax=Streptomyces sp. NPDC088812 TaxID=3365905 RepID=UPI00381AAE54